MKRVFSMVIALATAVMSYSQSSLIATLSHNGEVSAFYGASALQEAHAAAQHGDIITLSGGMFTATDIEKALTIRGAGMYVDSVAQILPTVISGNFYIEVPDSIEQHLTMEGIYSDYTITVKGTLADASFQKCRLKTFGYYNVTSTKIENLTFIHCKIEAGLKLPTTAFVSCVNCYINDPVNSASSSNIEFLNCIVRKNYADSFSHSSFTNCIIISTYNYFSSSCTALYCLGISMNGYDMFSNSQGVIIESKMFTGELNELFKTYTGTYDVDNNETFELTDLSKGLYVGNDLKQVGMYGGNYPFNPTPTNPRIVKCIVAPESTSDGKLSVDIEVSSAE